MANGQTTQVTAGAGTLADSIVKFNQMQAELIGNMMRLSLDVFQSVNRLSLEIAISAATAFTQVLQGISTSIAPKK